jgi:hypothetical protein
MSVTIIKWIAILQVFFFFNVGPYLIDLYLLKLETIQTKRAAAHPAAELAGHARRRRIKMERGFPFPVIP